MSPAASQCGCKTMERRARGYLDSVFYGCSHKNHLQNPNSTELFLSCRCPQDFDCRGDLHDCLIFSRFGIRVSSAFAVYLLHGDPIRFVDPDGNKLRVANNASGVMYNQGTIVKISTFYNHLIINIIQNSYLS